MIIKTTKNKLRFLLIFMVFISLSVAVKLTYVHFFDQTTTKLSKKIEPHEIRKKGKRGNILAADGKALAITSGEYNLHIDFAAPGISQKLFSDKVDSLSHCLARLFRDRSAYSYKSSLKKAYKRKDRYYKLGNRNINQAEFYLVKSFPYLRQHKYKSGLIIQETSKRIYPLGFRLGRTIGRLYKKASKDKVEEKYAKPVGLYGLEAGYEKELSGEKGLFVTLKVPRTTITKSVVAPKPGQDIVTTLDTKVQDYAEQALSKKMREVEADWGTAIVMDVRNGDLKAIANLEYKNGKVKEGKQNYALGNSGCVEPGSTFKAVSIMAALETNLIDTSTVIHTGKGIYKYRHNNIIRDSNWGSGGNGDISLTQVMEKSSNVGTVKVVDKVFENNQTEFVDRLYALQLNTPIHLKIKGMASPVIPHPERNNQNWNESSLAWMSFGYGFKISPMHTLSFYAAVANNGVMMAPRLVKGVMNGKGKLDEFTPKIRVAKICSDRTLKKLQDMLLGVLENGTAKNLRSNHYKIAGKTGTTQIFDHKQGYLRNNHNASFVGYFPADNPKYAVMVMIGNPKSYTHYGGTVAGPVFADIADVIYAQDSELYQSNDNSINLGETYLPHTTGGNKKDLTTIYDELQIDYAMSENSADWVSQTNKENQIELINKSINNNIMPDLNGIGMSDAIYLLENNGWHVHVKGFGRVKEQSPKKGNKLRKGTHIYLKMG